MNGLTHRQTIELFHLIFLAQLGRKLDKREFVLKGGCNLRFFFKSPRYSEDIDLDVGQIPVHVLREKVAGILASAPLRQILQVHGLDVEDVREHKQTETTQRWKLALRVGNGEARLPTKIEFSRRGVDETSAFESIDPMVIRAYDLPPFMTSHYPRNTAFRQKVEALITRRAPQARDVFDLHLLHASGAAMPSLEPGLKAGLDEARSKVLAMSFDEFKSQVVAYLLPADQAPYDSEDAWDRMRLEVIESLRGDVP